MSSADPAMTAVAADLVRSVRGKRSQPEFSRRIGYASNISPRWEAGRCWPTAAVFLSACARIRPATRDCFTRFFKRAPEWFDASDPFTPDSVAAFMREIAGKTPIRVLAERMGCSRFTVGRWLSGTAQPKLPEFLQFIDAASRRMLDFVAGITDPARMPTLGAKWSRLQRARQVAYDEPWSHAVLRALELDAYRKSSGRGERWLATQLGVGVPEVKRALEVLAATGQIRKARGRWRVDEVRAVDTGHDARLARGLKVAWTRVALDRLVHGAPGNYGYSVFAVSRRDLRRLREIHLQYVRAMQSLIADSGPAECVGLYCAQLLHLSAGENALAE
jgi:hypothetical protein